MLNLKNTLDGYLKNVEVIGNTVQDTNNLADIRSVGDKVKGQELYKIPVVSCGKNLFDKEALQNNCSLHPDTGEFTTGNNWIASPEYYPVEGGRTIVISGCATLNNIICFYDYNYNFISSTKDSLTKLPILVPDNARFFRFRTASKSNIQIEYGEVTTVYESYKGDKLEILSPVQLEKVGDVADRIICKDGVWGVEKNIKTYVVSEDTVITRHNQHANGTTSYRIENVLEQPNLTVITSKFKQISFSELFSLGDIGHASHDTATYLYVRLEGNTNTDIAKQQLQGMLIKYMTSTPQFIPLPHDQQVKLRTFAGQTNIAFLTGIPGQIKAQVPKSLGATVNTHTEQIADLHNSLDRVKKLEETTVSTVETESNFTTVDATSNGYFEDVKLEGKTLVNLVKNHERSQGNVNATNKGFNVTKGNRTIEYVLYRLQQPVKLDTDYTLIYTIKSNTITNSDLTYGLYADGVYGVFPSQTISGGKFDGKIGTFSVKLRTNESQSNKDILSIGLHYADEGGYLEVDNIILLEGDHTNNPPEYFGGLMSVGQDVEELIVGSCDFVDIAEFESGGFNAEGYPVENGTRVRTSNYIPYASTKLKLYMLDSQEAEIVFYNKDKTRLSNIAWVKDGDIVAVPNNTQYVKVALRYPSNAVISPSDIKYFKMSCPKDKKPLLYYNPTTETWEKPVLREWDTIEKHSDGKYYYHKRSGEVVLNGSESWSFNGSTDGIGNWYSSTIASYTKEGSICIADKLNNIPGNTHNKEGIRIGTTKNIAIQLNVNSVVDNKLSNWLKANPTTIVYQLAKEEIYECTNIDLMTYSGETNYIINSGAISPKSLLKVHNNISNVVKILQEKVNLLENTFIAGLKSVLSGDMYSLATILYPEDFEQNDNTEQDIMVIPE